MNTKLEMFNGVLLEVPDHPDFFWPCRTFEGFPSCCGSGSSGSIGERLVRDEWFGINISPACWSHDFMFEKCLRTLKEFHWSNSVFLRNILSIISRKGNELSPKQLQSLTTIAIGYHEAVSTGGMVCFFGNDIVAKVPEFLKHNHLIR